MPQAMTIICDEYPGPKTRLQLISESIFLQIFCTYISLCHLLKPTCKVSEEPNWFAGALAVAACRPGTVLGTQSPSCCGHLPPPTHLALPMDWTRYSLACTQGLERRKSQTFTCI